MTKDNITTAALRLFLLKGYKNVSLIDVANEVGITKGGIYHYFESKEALLRVSASYLFDRVEAKYAELFSSIKDFRDILTAVMVERELELFIEELLGINRGDYRANHARLALEVMHSFPGFHDRLDESHRQLLQVIEQKLQEAREKCQIRQDLDANILATIILSILCGQNVLSPKVNLLSSRQQVLDSIWALVKA